MIHTFDFIKIRLFPIFPLLTPLPILKVIFDGLQENLV